MLIARRNAMRVGSGVRPYWGLTFTAEEAGSTVSMTKVGDAPAVSLETSTDNGRTWTPFVVGETTITLADVGDSVYFRAGDGGTGGDGLNVAMGLSSSIRNSFTTSGRIAASGDISSLLDRSGTVLDLSGRGYCLNGLFYDCTSLTTAPELPATTLAPHCYHSMFRGCTSLVNAPTLTADSMNVGCYYGMFYDCTSLTVAPELPATTLANQCYASMFSGCTSLTTAPELTATVLSGRCYTHMFSGCTSLVSAPPELPATTLLGSCYQQMFSGCTSLTTAPELPATTLANLCYASMFSGCTSLAHVKVRFTEWNPTNATKNWLSGVAASGTFECPDGLNTTTRNGSHVPEGWNVVNLPVAT